MQRIRPNLLAIFIGNQMIHLKKERRDLSKLLVYLQTSHIIEYKVVFF